MIMITSRFIDKTYKPRDLEEVKWGVNLDLFIYSISAHQCIISNVYLQFAQNVEWLERLLSFTAETFQIIVFLPNFPVENVVVSVSCQTVRPVSGVQSVRARCSTRPSRSYRLTGQWAGCLSLRVTGVEMMNNCVNIIIPVLGCERLCALPQEVVVVQSQSPVVVVPA